MKVKMKVKQIYQNTLLFFQNFMKFKNPKKNCNLKQGLNQLKIQDKKEVEFKLGLAILRPILAFLVVMTHCYNDKKHPRGFWRILIRKTENFYFHVRTFCIMTFYFSYRTLISKDCKKKLKRLERLFIPYILWTIIIFISNNLLSKYTKINREVSFKDLKDQLMFGYVYIFPCWYQWNMIFLTIFFIVIISLFRRRYHFILIMISIISFIYQYNGKNKKFFDKHNDKHQKRLLEE